MTEPTQITIPRCGDQVRHKPSGESWVVAWAEGDDIAWAGWPNGIARLSDCEVIHRCSDDEHRKEVTGWQKVNDPRAARVMRLYGGAINDDRPEQIPLGPGDVVSQPDGPPMTVESLGGDLVHCVWFAGEEVMRDAFRRQRLQIVQR
jgi:uncharacterized protein YodC (DUF2158 family)